MKADIGTERSEFLQIMRFVAAALVLITHTTFYYQQRINPQFAVWHPGEVGVLIFFVISGIVMVVSTPHLPRDASGARVFMLRRLIRIAPLYWLATLLKVSLSVVQPDAIRQNQIEPAAVIQSLLFIPFFNAQHFVWPVHGVGWTLMHEMFFYSLFALALLCGRRPILWVSAIIIGLYLAGLFVTLDRATWLIASNVNNLHFVVGMWVGGLLLRAKDGAVASTRFNLLAATGLVAFTAWAALQAWWPFDTNFSLALGFAALALVLTGWSVPRTLAPLTRLGDSSYSTYLFHPFLAPASMLAIARVWPAMPAALHILLTVLFTLAAAHVIHLLVEQPVVLWFRTRLAPFATLPRLTYRA